MLKRQRILGVCMCSALLWKTQFQKMHKRFKDAITKLKNITIIAPLVYVYFNAYLLKVVYFSCGIIKLTSKQESVLKKLYKSTILQKLGLSKNMP